MALFIRPRGFVHLLDSSERCCCAKTFDALRPVGSIVSLCPVQPNRTSERNLFDQAYGGVENGGCGFCSLPESGVHRVSPGVCLGNSNMEA